MNSKVSNVVVIVLCTIATALFLISSIVRGYATLINAIFLPIDGFLIGWSLRCLFDN